MVTGEIVTEGNMRMAHPFRKHIVTKDVDLENYGCEKANVPLPKEVFRLLKSNRVKNAITVRCRNTGMTGSGMFNECHRNVAKLVKSYGGKHLMGFSVTLGTGVYGNGLKSEPLLISTDKRPDIVRLQWHSVWVTPEGCAVDVTTYRTGSRETIIFYPCHIVTEINDAVGVKNLVVPFKYRKKGLWINGLRADSVRDIWDKDISTDKDKKWIAEGGGFSKPSIATGRYLNEWKEVA